MPLFNESVIRATIAQVLRQQQHLTEALYFQDTNNPVIPLQQSPLLDNLTLLVRVANGEIRRAAADPEQQALIATTLQDVVELVLCPVWEGAYTVPETFWQTEIGQVCLRVQWWLRGEEMITLSEAAQLLFPDTQPAHAAYLRIKRLLDAGTLTAYADPAEANSQRARRVLRSDIEQLAAERSRPE